MVCVQHIEANTKWPPFSNWWKLYFDRNCTQFCSHGPNWQHTSIGLYIRRMPRANPLSKPMTTPFTYANMRQTAAMGEGAMWLDSVSTVTNTYPTKDRIKCSNVVIYSVLDIFDITNSFVRFFKSFSHNLAGITASQLWWYLQNTNMVHYITTVIYGKIPSDRLMRHTIRQRQVPSTLEARASALRRRRCDHCHLTTPLAFQPML